MIQNVAYFIAMPLLDAKGGAGLQAVQGMITILISAGGWATIIVLLNRTIQKKKSYEQEQSFKVNKEAMLYIVGWVIGTMLVVYCIMWIIETYLYTYIPEEVWFWPYSVEAMESAWEEMGPIYGFIAACMIAPITEEWVFRGVFLKGLSKHYSVTKAIIVSSILFGTLHIQPARIIIATLVGIVLGTLYIKYESLGVCMVFHSIYNGVAGFVLWEKVHPIIYVIASIGMGWILWKSMMKLDIQKKLIDEAESENSQEEVADDKLIGEND